MSNNQVKIKCELFKRTNELDKTETFDLKLELTNFTRDDLLSFLTEVHGSIANYTKITPPDEAT
ncbi:hypothetical protein [Nostoc sp. NMS4]|uniref:hypothetical protein n=1 Tax=Nostoc sp. NMS4 TaxID=2815390 RepID=UPI0025FDCBA4|nr:hypothetical protein [Nostoc sp. NMS4]MBN3924849.1 hypothetical protein [Nostoc sp. NMS4]